MNDEANGSLADRLINKLKNNPLVAVLILIATVIAGLASFGTSISELLTDYHKYAPPSLDISGPWNDDDAWKKVIATVKARREVEHNLLCASGSEATCEVEHAKLGIYNLHYKNNESMVVAVSSNEVGNDCHQCAPFLSFFEFSKEEKGWKLIHADLAVASAGSFGKLNVAPAEAERGEDAKITVEPIGDNIYGVFLEGGYTGQGYTTRTESIFARVGDTVKTVMSIDSGEDDSWNGKDVRRWQWNSDFSVRPGTVGFYDIEVNQHGIGDGETVSRHLLFKFDGNEYVQSTHLK